MSVRPVIAVQHRRRLVRDCLVQIVCGVGDCQILAAEDAEVLRASASEGDLTHAVIEAQRVPWDFEALVRELRTAHGRLRIAALGVPARTAARLEVDPVSARADEASLIAALGFAGPAKPSFPFTATAPDSAALSPQQFRVLSLLSLGLATREIASRLAVTEHAVGQVKAALFDRLDVQSQSEAVAAALRQGLLRPAVPGPGG